MHVLGRKGVPTIPVAISTSTPDVNVFALAGSPGYVCNVVLTIGGAGTYNVYSTGTYPAIRTAGFAAGSTLKIIVNNFTISGKAGQGGAGGDVSSHPTGYPGLPGGDAIDVRLPITIDNTNGYICGGPGGGGGSGSSMPAYNYWGGGGGGGGRGFNNATGGAGKTGTWNNGSNGSTGSGSAKGAGGSSGAAGVDGGNGGDWGANGTTGGTIPGGSAGGPGGNAGKAIALNGYSITWLGGNNPSQVKGAVS